MSGDWVVVVGGGLTTGHLACPATIELVGAICGLHAALALTTPQKPGGWTVQAATSGVNSVTRLPNPADFDAATTRVQ